jgi:hypothetical protein
MITLSQYSEVRIDKSQLQVGDLLDINGIYSVVETEPKYDGLGFNVRLQPLVEFQEIGPDASDATYLVGSGLRYFRSLRANGMQVSVLRNRISSLK